MTTSALPATGLTLRAVAHQLERCGWTPTDFDVDLGRGTLRLQLKRFDGRLVTLWADRHGRAYVEREGVDVSRFLGRQRFDDPHQALESLAGYVADNPAEGRAALTSAEARQLLFPLLGAALGRALAPKAEGGRP
jgi:hypothetical protein